MFGKYNIQDLFLAKIKVVYSTADYNPRAGLVMSRVVNYEYNTILLERNGSYIDLQNPKKSLGSMAYYDIISLEPLSNYYTPEGKNKRKVTKKEVAELSKKYYKK